MSSKWKGEIKQENNRRKISKAKYKEISSTSLTNETRHTSKQILMDYQGNSDHKRLLRFQRENSYLICDGGQALRGLTMTSMSWNSDPSLCNSLPLSMGRTCDLLLTKEHHKGEGIYITHDYGAWDLGL